MNKPKVNREVMEYIASLKRNALRRVEFSKQIGDYLENRQLISQKIKVITKEVAESGRRASLDFEEILFANENATESNDYEPLYKIENYAPIILNAVEDWEFISEMLHKDTNSSECEHINKLALMHLSSLPHTRLGLTSSYFYLSEKQKLMVDSLYYNYIAVVQAYSIAARIVALKSGKKSVSLDDEIVSREINGELWYDLLWIKRNGILPSGSPGSILLPVDNPRDLLQIGKGLLDFHYGSISRLANAANMLFGTSFEIENIDCYREYFLHYNSMLNYVKTDFPSSFYRNQYLCIDCGEVQSPFSPSFNLTKITNFNLVNHGIIHLKLHLKLHFIRLLVDYHVEACYEAITCLRNKILSLEVEETESLLDKLKR